MGCADDLLCAAKAGEIAFSDAFPYVGEQLYIPKPMVSMVRTESSQRQEPSDSRERKASKRLKYIPLTVLDSYLAGTLNFVRELEKFDLGVSFLRTKVNLTRATSDDAEPYHVGGFSFNPECGIYFVIRGSFDVKPLFDQLGYSGIGGKRSSGYGRFSAEFASAKPFGGMLEVDPMGRSMLLSSSLPREDELTDELLEGAKYLLRRKSGFVQSAAHAASPRKKRDMWLFEPGSVFARRFEGDVFDVNATPGAHTVQRYARPMWMEV